MHCHYVLSHRITLIKSDPPLKNTFIQLLKLHFSARSSVKFPVQVLRTGEQNTVCSKNDVIESTDPKLSASLSLCSCSLSHILHSFLHFVRCHGQNTSSRVFVLPLICVILQYSSPWNQLLRMYCMVLEKR